MAPSLTRVILPLYTMFWFSKLNEKWHHNGAIKQSSFCKKTTYILLQSCIQDTSPVRVKTCDKMVKSHQPNQSIKTAAARFSSKASVKFFEACHITGMKFSQEDHYQRARTCTTEVMGSNPGKGEDFSNLNLNCNKCNWLNIALECLLPYKGL